MADNIQATPRNYVGGLLTDAYKWMQSPERTQQMQGFAGLLGTTGVPQTIERMAYGEPLTNISRANVPLLKPETADALMTVAPMVGPAARGAEAGLLSAGRAGERYAERVVPQIMERGGMPAQLLGDLAQGNKRQVLAYHGTNAQDILAPKSSLEDMYDRTGFTGWFSESPELANYYSLARGVEGGAVMPVDIKMKKPLKLSFDMNDSPEEAMKIAEKLGLDRDFFPNVFSDKNKRAFEVVNDRNFKQAALEAGYDSIQVPEEGVMTFAPLLENANQVKSVFDLKQKGLLGQQAKSTFTYPQEEAMRLAQQRAALPKEQFGLGLSPYNTAQQRADAMFPFDVYHGTNADIQAMNTAGKGKTSGAGAFVNDNPLAAETYVNASGGGNIIPMRMSKEGLLDVNAKGRNWADIETNTLAPKAGKKRYSLDEMELSRNDVTSTDELGTIANDLLGLKGVNIKNVKDLGPNSHIFRAKEYLQDKYGITPDETWSNVTGSQFGEARDYMDKLYKSQKSTVTAVQDPDLLRSRFAAFDPWRRTAAIASAMGVAAPDLLAQEQPVITQQQIDDEMMKYGLIGK